MWQNSLYILQLDYPAKYQRYVSLCWLETILRLIWNLKVTYSKLPMRLSTLYNNYNGVRNSHFQAKSNNFFYFLHCGNNWCNIFRSFLCPVNLVSLHKTYKEGVKKHEKAKDVYTDTNCVSFCLFNSSYNWTSSLPGCVKYTLHLQ